MKRIHNRMPVLLDADARAMWLDPNNQAGRHLATLLEPYAADRMEAYPVSKIVNSPANDTEECVKPLKGGDV